MVRKSILLIVAAFFFGGCALSPPPPPPEARGEYRPVNPITTIEKNLPIKGDVQ